MPSVVYNGVAQKSRREQSGEMNMKKAISIILAVIMMLGCITVIAGAAETKDYTIVSPYEDVIWSGDGAWGAYKGNLHTHSYVSDGDDDYRDMILEYYNQGFDFLAMTEHGVTGKDWDEEPTHLPLYLYQYIIGNKPTSLTSEEYAAVQDGSYPVNGTARGNGMTAIIGGNELNALTITKCHVNGMFLPAGVGDNYLGYENDHEGAVKLTHEAGGISFINHPGDWLNSNRDRSVIDDPDNINYFANIILKYDSCYGMEVYNEKNSVTPHDAALWDNILMQTLPYGKTVIAYSNSDAHTTNYVDSSFNIYMMKANTVENIKETMMNGASFCVTRNLPADEKLGPAEAIQARNTDLPYPEFTEVTVDGHTLTVKVKNCYNIKWIANCDVIASQDIEASENETVYTIDLDDVDGAEDFLYVRCQLLGEGGCTLTQALIIDNGTEKLTYDENNPLATKYNNPIYKLLSARIFVLFKVIIDKLKSLAC